MIGTYKYINKRKQLSFFKRHGLWKVNLTKFKIKDLKKLCTISKVAMKMCSKN